MTDTLGRLQKVLLREAWASEAGDFTPWLAQPENLKLLGESVGMELEAEAQEQSVGPFRADILCREVGTNAWVLIENQLERTDHVHLGQLLTYAAGLNAVSIIWIAQRFTDEHRAALDWLNQKTPEDIAFFGLEVELWRIGDSPAAPKFNVVCKPNEWTRAVAASTDHSEVKQLCWDFWSGVLAEIEPSGILLPTTTPRRRQDIRFDVGWHSFFLKAYFSRVEKKQGVWLSCRGPGGLENFCALRDSRQQIEQTFGQPLDWTAHEDRNQGTCNYYLLGHDANDRSDWPTQHRLIADKVLALYRAVKPLVESLDNRPTGAPGTAE